MLNLIKEANANREPATKFNFEIRLLFKIIYLFLLLCFKKMRKENVKICSMGLEISVGQTFIVLP